MVVAVEDPFVAGDQVTLLLAPLVLRRLHPARFPEVDVEWTTGRPVLADNARENVLLPAPAMPVTTIRRPTENPGGMSLADRITMKASSGTSAYCRIPGGRGGIVPI